MSNIEKPLKVLGLSVINKRIEWMVQEPDKMDNSTIILVQILEEMKKISAHFEELKGE